MLGGRWRRGRGRWIEVVGAEEGMEADGKEDGPYKERRSCRY